MIKDKNSPLYPYEAAPCCCFEDVHIPKTLLKPTIEGVEEFNRIYQWAISDDNKYGPWGDNIRRTPKGYISKVKGAVRLPAYDVQVKKNSVQLTILCPEGNYRFIMSGRNVSENDEISGSEAFREFKRICLRHGINLEDFAIDNGKAVKKTIPSPRIELADESLIDQTLTNVHHADLNSSYFSGISKAFPKLAPPVQEIYDKRHDDDGKYKAILTHTYGFMQSEWCHLNHKGYALAHMSKAAIEYNNAFIDMLTKSLIASGRKIIAYNTDGIFYQGDIYHDDYEGKNLRQWKNDLTNITIRFKSKGAYEYITEDGKYKPVVRGTTKLDRIKPREEWSWGDIYQKDAEPLNFEFVKGVGLVWVENKN